MQCPVCKKHEHDSIELRSGSFNEGLLECRICGSVWSVNHGLMSIVRDSMADSFMEALSASVEGDNYCFAAA